MPTPTYKQLHAILRWLATESSDDDETDDETEFTVRLQDWELRGVCDTRRKVVTVLNVTRAG